RMFSTSTANWITDRQLRSVCTTTLPMLRWTNISPGIRPTISLAGTRLSEQPIQRYSGACWRDSSSKNPGCELAMRAAQARFLRKSSCSVFTADDSTGTALASRTGLQVRRAPPLKFRIEPRGDYLLAEMVERETVEETAEFV